MQQAGFTVAAMDPDDVVAPDFFFRGLSAFPKLQPNKKKTSLHAITQASQVAKFKRLPTIIHMYDSC